MLHHACRAAAFLIAIAICSSAMADPVADFYRGKSLMFYIRAAPGGNYDVYSRALAPYLTRHLPGNPAIVPINMPGGGGLVALNYVANVAPKDGTAITMMTQSFPMDQALGLDKSLKVDLRTLNWIGNMSETNEFFFVSKKSPTKTWRDARDRVTVMAATGSGSITMELVAMFNNLLGTKFRIIFGYPSGPDMSLAMERGEVEGRSTSNPQVLAPTIGEVIEKYNFLLQVGLRKTPQFAQTPLLSDLARDETQRSVFNFISKAVVIARPIVTNAGAPSERVAALRRAFDAAMRDPDFLADAAKLNLEIASTRGEELERLVNGILDAPPAVRTEVARAMQMRPDAMTPQGAQ